MWTLPNLSAEYPIVSPEENSDTLGNSGMKKPGRIEASNPSLCCNVLALFALNNKLRIFLLCLIGISDINSTPPHTIVSNTPLLMSPIAKTDIWGPYYHIQYLQFRISTLKRESSIIFI